MTDRIELTVNGEAVGIDSAPAVPLLDVLRNRLGLMGTRFGCGLEQCGSCMVLIDGEPVYACTLKVASAAGRQVVTVEGLAVNGELHPLQRAFLAEQAGQCGYCLSGVLISAAALIARNPRPSRSDIVNALDKHLCRCGIRNRIIRAVERAAEAMRASARP